MDDPQATMELLKTRLAAALPTRVITREPVDVGRSADADLVKGILALVVLKITDLRAPREIAAHAGKLIIGVAADIKLAENAGGAAVEAAELAFWKELLDFLKAPGAGLCPLDALEVQFSGQAAAPYGWFFARLEYSEID